MPFHSMRELVIWHGERGLLWQLGPALAPDEDAAEGAVPDAKATDVDRRPSFPDPTRKRSGEGSESSAKPR